MICKRTLPARMNERRRPDRLVTVLLVLLGCILYGCATVEQGTPDAKKPKSERPQQIRTTWPLTLEDEFDGESIDTDKWEICESRRRPGPEGDGYWSKEDAYLDGKGNLVLRARKMDDGINYASGALRSKGKFEQKHGYFEIRCKLPKEIGWWTAFWLMSPSETRMGDEGRDGTEIDIFEDFWRDRDWIHHGLHWDGYAPDHGMARKTVRGLEGIHEGFHTFALEWNEHEYVFYVDDRETWRTSAGGVSQVPAYVKVTAEISTRDWAVKFWGIGDPKEANWPDYFIVDYVRVYKETGSRK
jgi:beta-glucanase (GH16 family)